MTIQQAIEILEKNRDLNLNKPKFVSACNMAITALRENKPLKNRCRALTGMSLCEWCSMECPNLGGDEDE